MPFGRDPTLIRGNRSDLGLLSGKFRDMLLLIRLGWFWDDPRCQDSSSASAVSAFHRWMACLAATYPLCTICSIWSYCIRPKWLISGRM